jgi:hypothetical protein
VTWWHLAGALGLGLLVGRWLWPLTGRFRLERVAANSRARAKERVVATLNGRPVGRPSFWRQLWRKG